MMVPISPENHVTPTLPPPPSFADFKFTVIGQPQLLKRLTTPVPDFRPSPTPAHMELQYPSRATTPSTSPPALHRPSLLERLEIVDNTTTPLLQDMLIPQSQEEDEMTVDQKPVIRNVAPAPLPDPDLTYGAEDNPCPSIINSPKSPLVIDPHSDTVSKPAASDLAIGASPRATTVVQHESSPNNLVSTLSPPCAATPLPLSTGRGEEASAPVHPAPSQQVLQIQYALALSYETALLAFEKAEHVFTLARENYDAAKVSLAAAAKAQMHFRAAVSPVRDERVGGVGKMDVVPDQPKGELDSRTTATKDGEGHASAASSRYPTTTDRRRVTLPSASPALTAVLKRSMNRRVIELEREANDARLAWSLESVERPKSDSGARARARRRADGYVGLVEEDEAPEPESRPRIDGVRASQSASASQVSTHASITPTRFLYNPATGLEVPQADPQHLRTQDLIHSSASSLPQAATPRPPSSKPTFQTYPLGTSQTIHDRDMLLNTDTDQDNTHTRHTAPVPIPTPPVAPSNAPQLSTAWATCRAGPHIATAPRPPDVWIATMLEDGALQDVSSSSGSTLPSTPSEAMVDELLDDCDDDDDDRSYNLKLEFEFDPDADSRTVVGVETKPLLYHRGGARWSVRQDGDDEVGVGVGVENDERWKGGSGRGSLGLQGSRRSSAGLEGMEPVVGGGFVASSAGLGARGNCEPSFRYLVDLESPLVHTQKVVEASLTRGDAPGTSLIGERESEVDANHEVGNIRTEKSFEESHAEEASRHYALPLQHNNIRDASDSPFPSPVGTLLQRLQPPLEEPRSFNTTPTVSETPADPLRTPLPVSLGKRRHVDDHSMTPPDPHVPPPKRRLSSANPYNSPPPPPLRNQNHPTSPIERRIRDAPAHRNAEGSTRPPSAPRRMYHQSHDNDYSHTPRSHYDRYVPRNTHWPTHGARGRSVSPLGGGGGGGGGPREHGDGRGVRLGAHRLVGARFRNSYRPRGAEMLRDRGGPPLSQRWVEKDLVPAVEKNGHGRGYGYGGMSLADRLRDP